MAGSARSMIHRFTGRLALQQRVLPGYRAPFFDLLAGACEGGMSLFAGKPRSEESISDGRLQVCRHYRAHNLHILDGAFYFCYQRGILKWLEEWDPDVLIVEANLRYLSTPRGVSWMKQRQRPVLAWGLGVPEISGPLASLQREGWSQFLNQFNGLISYSHRGAQEYTALGFPQERIFIAPNAVANRPLSPPDRKAHTFSRSTVLFVGRLQARKRVDSLLRACSKLPDKPRLIIVGEGPERAGLEKLAEEVYPSAEFMGAIHGDELRPIYAEADLFVLPGTGGLAVQQAMSHGLPVVVARGDGTQDDLVRKENGWQIRPGDEAVLVATLRAALSDGTRLQKMGQESYRIVSQEINLETMVVAFIEALNQIFELDMPGSDSNH